MEKDLVKTLVKINIIDLIASDLKLSISEARDRFFNSKLDILIDDDETGYYGDSPVYLYYLYKKEFEKKKIA